MGDPGQGGLLEPIAGSTPPSAEAQLAFLAKLQRLFAAGDFTATYKFALLIVLADLAVELGQDDGSSLTVSVRQVADRFVQLYWKQAAPYGTGRPGTNPGVLVQNLGAQAAVVREIVMFREATRASSAQAARLDPAYPGLVQRVARTVSAQPLTYLQNFGGSTNLFLFERLGRGLVRLKAGVPFCLRKFQPLIQEVARNRWVDHIKDNRRNVGILGSSDDLEDFLFAASRQSLAALAAGLRRIDGSRCFYCGERLGSTDVDHFVPFALYPRDLAHNFVLAHDRCNRSKSDMLAARGHLERWLERLERHGDDLAEVGVAAGIVVDSPAMRQVASWGYANALSSGASAWVAPNKFELVDPSYASCFA